MPPRSVRGGILADEMGLGKRFTVLAHLANSLDHAKAFAIRRPECEILAFASKNSRGTLIILRKSLLPQWQNQIEEYLVSGRVSVHSYFDKDRILAFASKNSRVTLIILRKSLLPQWQNQIEEHLVSGRVSVHSYFDKDRNLSIDEIVKFDVVLTTYETVKGELRCVDGHP